MHNAPKIFPVFLLILFFSATCAGPRIVFDRDEALNLVSRLESIYADAEAIILRTVRDGAPLDAADRMRLAALRSEAAQLYEHLKLIARQRDDAGLLIKLAGALLEVLP